MHGYALVERLSPASLAVLALVAGPHVVLAALRRERADWETPREIERLMRQRPMGPHAAK